MKPVLFSYVMMLTLTPTAKASNELKINPNPTYKLRSKKCSGFDLFQALELGQKSCVDASLKNMDINETNEEGDTPLHVAVRMKAYPILVHLIKKGADLNQINFQSQTARDLADSLGERKVSDLLLKIETETKRLYVAIENNDNKAALASIHRGASIGSRDVRLDTLLHRAAQSGFSDIADLLIKNGASVHARNYLGETPLHNAVMRGFVPMVNLLLKSGADVNAVDERRQTPMDLAQSSEDPNLWRLLKTYSARKGTAAQVNLDISMGEGLNSGFYSASGNQK